MAATMMVRREGGCVMIGDQPFPDEPIRFGKGSLLLTYSDGQPAIVCCNKVGAVVYCLVLDEDGDYILTGGYGQRSYNEAELAELKFLEELRHQAEQTAATNRRRTIAAGRGAYAYEWQSGRVETLRPGDSFVAEGPTIAGASSWVSDGTIELTLIDNERVQVIITHANWAILWRGYLPQKIVVWGFPTPELFYQLGLQEQIGQEMIAEQLRDDAAEWRRIDPALGEF